MTTALVLKILLIAAMAATLGTLAMGLLRWLREAMAPMSAVIK